MADVGVGAASTSLPSPATASGQMNGGAVDISANIKPTTSSSDHTITDGLIESLQNALKRQWPEDPDASTGNEERSNIKRAKTVLKAPNADTDASADANWDIGALLETALGTMGQLTEIPTMQQIHEAVPIQAGSSTPSPAEVSLPTALLTGHTASTTPSLPTEGLDYDPCIPTDPYSQQPIAPDIPRAGILCPDLITTPGNTSVITDTEETGKEGPLTGTNRNGIQAFDMPIRERRMQFSRNPTYITRSMGLPILGSLAVQILHALSERPRSESLDSFTSTDSETGRCYLALRATFYCARKLFSDSSALLIPEELDIKELGDQETIQMVNMATICTSVFGADDIQLIDIHDHFLMAFLPESGALSEELATLFLALKFRTLANEFLCLPDDQQRGEFLERLFPADLEDQLKQLHPEMPLCEQETAFLSEMMASKVMLLEAVKTDKSRRQLAERFPLESFRNELSAYLRENADVILKYAETHDIEIPSEEDASPETQTLSDAMGEVSDSITSILSDSGQSRLEMGPANTRRSTADLTEPTSMAEELTKFIQEAVQKGTSVMQANGATVAGDGLASSSSSRAVVTNKTSGETNLSGLTMLLREKLHEETRLVNQPQSPVTAANAALTSMQNTYANQLALYQGRSSSISDPSLATPPGVVTATHTPSGSGSNMAIKNTTGTANVSLPPNQSSPSAVLYQRARQAAAAKTTMHVRREGLHSTRRPWTPDEEQALMAGLDMVKGPHWSQILQLFGANGSISDILKDRSQVQLKDKARNLKLFFLKTNSEMPYYLHCVTGELKTRAPGQAARKEAEERARSNSEEEQARIRGTMALAGGLRGKPRLAETCPTALEVPAKSPEESLIGANRSQGKQGIADVAGLTGRTPAVLPTANLTTPIVAPSPATSIALASSLAQSGSSPILQQQLRVQQGFLGMTRPIVPSASQLPAVKAALAAMKNSVTTTMQLTAAARGNYAVTAAGRNVAAALPSTPRSKLSLNTTIYNPIATSSLLVNDGGEGEASTSVEQLRHSAPSSHESPGINTASFSTQCLSNQSLLPPKPLPPLPQQQPSKPQPFSQHQQQHQATKLRVAATPIHDIPPLLEVQQIATASTLSVGGAARYHQQPMLPMQNQQQQPPQSLESPQLQHNGLLSRFQKPAVAIPAQQPHQPQGQTTPPASAQPSSSANTGSLPGRQTQVKAETSAITREESLEEAVMRLKELK